MEQSHQTNAPREEMRRVSGKGASAMSLHIVQATQTSIPGAFTDLKVVVGGVSLAWLGGFPGGGGLFQVLASVLFGSPCK